MSDRDAIVVKGARVNNLKGVDVELPRDSLIVVTGLSGSGKSSFAFDTLYAEGQRRYVESLSAYARQFVGRMRKPEVDFVTGIPPAVAIEQKVNTRNPRSTVGTSTEVYDYLRLLFARIGKTVSPVSGQVVKKHQVSDVVRATEEYPQRTRFLVCAPLRTREGQTPTDLLEIYAKAGYARVIRPDEHDAISIEDALIQQETEGGEETGEITTKGERRDAKGKKKGADVRLIEKGKGDGWLLVVDRLTTEEGESLRSRLAESVETAFLEGEGECLLRFYVGEEVEDRMFSKRFEADGQRFEEPSDGMFNFNSPAGACPKCEGFGWVIGVDEGLVIPDTNLSVYQGAVACWKGEMSREWLLRFIASSEPYGFPIHRPYCALSNKERDLLWHGKGKVQGIDDYFRFVESNRQSLHFRVIASRFRGRTICPDCHGMRLKPEALLVQVGGKHIGELVRLPLWELSTFFESLSLNETEQQIARRLLVEIRSRLRFLLDVGLGYLTLDRLSNTLSGGESQRISLATALGSSLTGSLYILDEPSIGLHPRDTDRLIHVLRQLQNGGNTVVVVEHDEEIIRSADYIVDIGPEAGCGGGELVGVFDQSLQRLQGNEKLHSHTLAYLRGEEDIPVPTRRPWTNFIEVRGARKNNLKGFDVRFPLNVMTVVSGVSGSGKSSLVRDIFYEGIRMIKDDAMLSGIEAAGVTGDVGLIHGIAFIGQHTLGRSSRSNPVTYTGAYDEIRQLYADEQLSRQMGYPAAAFSFNKEGGRCEACKGEGHITVEMQFMADIEIECEACKGRRFRKEILEVCYRGVNVADLLDMSVDEAIDFFAAVNGQQEQKIIRRLMPLRSVGLGYIRLGQTSSSLSGGENQRMKLASYLTQERPQPMLFVFDEPTTGLHFHDIKTLLGAFDALIGRGHTLVVVEHNLEVIKCADWLIDLGPEGGEAGGHLVCVGTPEEVAACKTSYTGQFLRGKKIL